jgi:hypothetical protein
MNPENIRMILKAQMREERAVFLGSGKIGPFGAAFSKLVKAVASGSKPIAEYDYAIYKEHKELCDKRLQDYGLEKIEDPVHKTYRNIWFFKPQNREDAIKRIDEVNRIRLEAQTRGYLAFEDHAKLGKLFGYSEEDINGFLSWRAVLILRSYVMTGKAEYIYRPWRVALQ